MVPLRRNAHLGGGLGIEMRHLAHTHRKVRDRCLYAFEVEAEPGGLHI
jgi:hypothetical protein